jgi:hypothetical protein
MKTVTSKTKKSIDDNFNKIQLEIHPSIVSFLTTFEKGRNDRLSAYVATVNHNVMNEATAYQIIHTLYGNTRNCDELPESSQGAPR